MQNGVVIFISRGDAERLNPISDVALISITDSLDQPAELKFGWHTIARYGFIDGEYDVHLIQHYTEDFEVLFASYFSRRDAELLKNDIEGFVISGVKKIVVHCEPGRSRSAAVAKYIGEKYGYTISGEVQHLNSCPSLIPDHGFTFEGKMNQLVYDLLCNPKRYQCHIPGVRYKCAKLFKAVLDNTRDWLGF